MVTARNLSGNATRHLDAMHRSLLHLALSGERFHVKPPKAQRPQLPGAQTLRPKD